MMTKLDQIKVAFRIILKDMIIKSVGILNIDDKVLVNQTAELMVKEVSIRTDLR